VEAEGRRKMGLDSMTIRHDKNDEIRSAHGREEGDNRLWDGVEETLDLQLLGRGRQRRWLLLGRRPMAERAPKKSPRLLL
jgi:hypothetical protein